MISVDLMTRGMSDEEIDAMLAKRLGVDVRSDGSNPFTQCLYRCFDVERRLSAVDYKVFLHALAVLSPTRTASAPPSLRARALYFTLQKR